MFVSHTRPVCTEREIVLRAGQIVGARHDRQMAPRDRTIRTWLRVSAAAVVVVAGAVAVFATS